MPRFYEREGRTVDRIAEREALRCERALAIRAGAAPPDFPPYSETWPEWRALQSGARPKRKRKSAPLAVRPLALNRPKPKPKPKQPERKRKRAANMEAVALAWLRANPARRPTFGKGGVSRLDLALAAGVSVRTLSRALERERSESAAAAAAADRQTELDRAFEWLTDHPNEPLPTPGPGGVSVASLAKRIGVGKGAMTVALRLKRRAKRPAGSPF